MEDKIKNVFTELKQIAKDTINLNNFAAYVSNSSIYGFLEPLKTKIELKLNKLPKNEAVKEIENWIQDIYVKTDLNDFGSQFWLELKDFLNNQKDEISESILNDKKIIRIKKGKDSNKYGFTQDEIAFILLYFIKNNLFRKNKSDTIISKCFSHLVDFGDDGIRQRMNESKKDNLIHSKKSLKKITDFFDIISGQIKTEITKYNSK